MVKLIAIANTLKELIAAKQAVLGSTESGKVWCLKALHPSDPATEVRGIPDKSAVPTVFLNYQSTFTVPPPGDTKPSWQFDAALIPHPVNFLTLEKQYSDGTANSTASFLNAQITGATHSAKYLNFAGLCERWRLAYMSVTVYQDAPSLADQGTIVVCQLPVQPLVTNVGTSVIPYPIGGSPSRITGQVKVETYQPGDYPVFERSQAMPNAYFSRSKEGAYVPLKLTKTCQKWHSDADSSMLGINETAADLLPVALRPYFVDTGFSSIPIVADLAAYNATGGGTYPHLGLHEATRVTSFTDGVVFGTSVTIGQRTSPSCNDNWAHISARNLSVSTSYSFFVRCGFEVQVQPGSILSPELKLSPMYDEEALKSYFMISREMKDAYPADYNDLGKIWNVIKGAARTVLPVLKNIPGPIGMIASAGEQIANGFGKLDKKFNPTYTPKRGSRDSVSAADKDRLQEAAAAPIRRRRNVVVTRKKPRAKWQTSKAYVRANPTDL